MTFKVVFQRMAMRDVDESLRWWSRLGKREAERWSARLLDRVVRVLEVDPHRFPEADEAVELGIDLRMLLHGKGRQVYRILFTIEGEEVLVQRVRHAAQDRITEL